VTRLEIYRLSIVMLIDAASKVPIVRRPENGPPFSICKGCESKDGEPCKEDCWVRRLGQAIHFGHEAIR